MKKIALLTLATSAMAVGVFANIKANKVSHEEQDATIIVRMKTNVDKHSDKALVNIQNSLLNEISASITSNYEVVSRYTNIFNGFALKVPSAYVSKIRNLDRVDTLDYNNFLAISTNNNDGVRY